MHHRHHATAAILLVPRSCPGRAFEAAGGACTRIQLQFVLNFFADAANPVSQLFKPGARQFLVLLNLAHFGKPSVCRSASARAMAPTCATLSERNPGCIG